MFHREVSYSDGLKQPIDLPQRLVSIDLARVVAILLMIQGHTIDVLLSPAEREGVIFDGWLFLRGLTAPMFFLLSGFSFAVSTSRRWDAYRTWSKPSVRRIGKFLFLILIGYALRSPARSLDGFRLLEASGWQGWLEIDVLQCIGLTLAFVQLLVILVGTRVWFARVAASLCACIVLLTPFVWGVEWTRYVSVAIASYLNSSTGSLFPIFPWSGYIFLGIAAGFVDTKLAKANRAAALHAAKAGALLISAGLFFESLPVTVYHDLDFWKTSPNLFLIRAGCACLMLAVTTRVAEWIRFPAGIVHSLSRESLVIYAVHICILYGSAWNLGLRQRIGSTLGLAATLGCVALMWIVMMGLALGWSKLKAANWLRTLVGTGVSALGIRVHPVDRARAWRVWPRKDENRSRPGS